MADVAERWEREELDAVNSGKWSPKGLDGFKVKNNTDAEGKTTEFANGYPATLRRRYEEGTSALFAKATPPRPPDPTEALVQVLQQREIRDDLKSLTQDERLDVAKSTTDPMVFHAIMSAPPTVTRAREGALPRATPFIDPAKREEALRAHAAILDPEGAAELRDLKATLDTYDHAINAVRNAIRAGTTQPRNESFRDGRGRPVTLPAPNQGS